MIIRMMTAEDIGSVVGLAQQLGYWVEMGEARGRVRRLMGREDHVLLVAQENSGEVLGWLHACEGLSLLGPARGEVHAVVVDERHRRRGIGRELLQECEKWARERGMVEVRLGTQTTRVDAQQFYSRLGYSMRKTQHVLSVEL